MHLWNLLEIVIFEFANELTKAQGAIFAICFPIIFIYIGYRIGTKGKFYELRKKVMLMRKRAAKLRSNPYVMQMKLGRLNQEIIRARNADKITELERIYLADSLNQVLYVPVHFG